MCLDLVIESGCIGAYIGDFMTYFLIHNSHICGGLLVRELVGSLCPTYMYIEGKCCGMFVHFFWYQTFSFLISYFCSFFNGTRFFFLLITFFSIQRI